MTGLLVLLDMAGTTIQQLQAEVARLQQALADAERRATTSTQAAPETDT